jgi:hypothetical protein
MAAISSANLLRETMIPRSTEIDFVATARLRLTSMFKERTRKQIVGSPRAPGRKGDSGSYPRSSIAM